MVSAYANMVHHPGPLIDQMTRRMLPSLDVMEAGRAQHHTLAGSAYYTVSLKQPLSIMENILLATMIKACQVIQKKLMSNASQQLGCKMRCEHSQETGLTPDTLQTYAAISQAGVQGCA